MFPRYSAWSPSFTSTTHPSHLARRENRSKLRFIEVVVDVKDVKDEFISESFALLLQTSASKNRLHIHNILHILHTSG
jgi:hypothetical protein